MPLRHAAPSPSQLPDSLHRLVKGKNNRADHLISYLDTLIKTGSESIEATIRRRKILFAGLEVVGGADCVGDQEKEWMVCFLDDLRVFGMNAY